MREQLTIENRIKQIKHDIDEIKTAQPITGDSWIPYRYIGSTSVPASSVRFLVFTQNDTTKRAVVKISQELGFDHYSTGMRSTNSKSVFILRNDDPFSPRGFVYVISSTQEGVVSVETTSPI